MLNFEIIQGSFDPFYSLIVFSRHFMYLIQIGTTNTCSSAPKWIEKHTFVSLGCMFRSHGTNVNEFNRLAILAWPQIL